MIVLAGSLAGTAVLAAGAGVLHPLVQARPLPTVTTNAHGWSAVADGSGSSLVRVGWIDPSGPVVPVTVTNSARPGETASVAYQIVIDDAGQPVGLLGPSGFVRGGVAADGSVNPSMLASLQSTADVHSVSPHGAPPRRNGA